MHGLLIFADLTICIRYVFVRKGNIYNGKLEFITAVGFIICLSKHICTPYRRGSGIYFSSILLDGEEKDWHTIRKRLLLRIEVSTTEKHQSLQLTTSRPVSLFLCFPQHLSGGMPKVKVKGIIKALGQLEIRCKKDPPMKDDGLVQMKPGGGFGERKGGNLL